MKVKLCGKGKILTSEERALKCAFDLDRNCIPYCAAMQMDKKTLKVECKRGDFTIGHLENDTVIDIMGKK